MKTHVTTDGTQTLTNKTLTGNTGIPVKATGAEINTGTDDVKFATPKAIADSNLGVIAQAEAWTSFVPTISGITIGSGTKQGYYCQIGKLVAFRIMITLAADSSVTGGLEVSLPVSSANYAVAAQLTMFDITFIDYGTTKYYGKGLWKDANTMYTQVFKVDGTYINYFNISSTLPHTWAVNDQIFICGTYEAA